MRRTPTFNKDLNKSEATIYAFTQNQRGKKSMRINTKELWYEREQWSEQKEIKQINKFYKQ